MLAVREKDEDRQRLKSLTEALNPNKKAIIMVLLKKFGGLILRSEGAST